MHPRLLKVLCAALLAGVAVFALRGLPAPEIVPHETVETVIGIAARLQIRNLVSAIYLGPRAVDTFLEVMVVTLAVIGMKHAWEDR
jgi:multisubunit Na+/H+ antiporter MnhB subunit